MKARFIVGWLLVLTLSAPAHAVSKNELAAQIAAVDERVARMEKMLGNHVFLEMLQRLEALQKEVQELRGENEEVRHELGQLKKRQRELYLDIDRRMQAREQRVVGELGDDGLSATDGGATGAAEASDTQVATAPATQSASANPQSRESYRKAFNLLKDGRYKRAISAFSKFLNDYPGSVYSANAQYWLAEANYVSKKYNAAATEFGKVLQNYPDSPKAPDATLKLGFTYYELAQWDDARNVLNTLGQQYPDSTVARLADKRLKRMKQEGH